MADDSEYEPDRVEGVPHPRHTDRLLGQDASLRILADAIDGGRMHHAWLLMGPRGIGKATLAWHAARALIARPPNPATGAPTDPAGAASLHLAPDHPVTRRVAALSDPSLFLMRPTRNPDTGTPRRQITVDVARRLRDFLALSATDGGHRAVIVDAADDMTVQAANAILKLLEEPPPRTTFLMVSHAPARLLPTIRSRCRTLILAPLAAPDLAAALDQAGLATDDDAVGLAQLSAGSVGEAARLIQEDGPALYADLVAALTPAPDLDRQRLLSLTGSLTPTDQPRVDVAVRLVTLFVSRLALYGAGAPPDAEAAPGESDLLARLAPDAAAGRRWALLQQEATARLAHGRAVNLDPSSLVLDTALTIHETGRAILAGRRV